MAIRIFILAIFFGLSLASCKNDTEATTGTTEPGMETITPEAQTPGATVSNPNPPHGEPGHRCDIPVGASLDTPMPEGYTPPAAQQPTSPVMQQPTSPVIQQQSAPSTAGVKNPNPPHGEPGHRCDIAVGASLDGQ